MLETFTGDIIGLILSYCSISDFKSLSLYSQSFYEVHFSDPNSSTFTEWLLQIISKSSERGGNGMTKTREMWNEIEKFKPYVWKQLSRRKLIPKGRMVDEISSLNCLQVISFMNNNWLEMPLLFYSSDFYTFQANSKLRDINGVLSVDLQSVEDIHQVMVQNEGITIEGWVNFASSWGVTAPEYLFYLKYKDCSKGIGIQWVDNSLVKFNVDGYCTKTRPVAPFTWVHVAGVYDMTTNRATMYINGELIDTVSVADYFEFEPNNTELVIGAQPNGGCISGEFTDIRVWNIARTHKQIRGSMGRRIFVYHFENTLDMNYLVFNCYPDPKMDEGQKILNKSPNFRYRTGEFDMMSNIEFLGGPIQSRLFHSSLKTAKFKI